MTRHPDGSRHPHHRCTCRPGQLNDAELAVVARLAEAVPVPKIAAELGYAPTSVPTFIRRARRKLGAANHTHLVALAFRDRLLGFDRDGRVVTTGRHGAHQ